MVQQATLANKGIVGQLQNEMLQLWVLMRQRMKLLNSQWEIGVNHEAGNLASASIWSVYGSTPAPQQLAITAQVAEQARR